MADNTELKIRESMRDGIWPRLMEHRQAPASIRAQGIGIRPAFRIGIVVLGVAAFLVTGALSFARISANELAQATADSASEITYLQLQLNALETRALAYEHTLSSLGLSLQEIASASSAYHGLLSDDVGNVLQGYTLTGTGTVLIAQDDRILASDDGRLPAGGSLQQLLGAEATAAINSSLASHEAQHIELAQALADTRDKDGYLIAGEQGDRRIVIIKPARMVYADRTATMLRELVISFTVLFAVLLAVDRMLVFMVARRIDGVNAALEQIVAGDLDARAPNEGTREFRSLAQGVNVTVDALKGWISEAEHRNEQDLATARRIQEGSLPHGFDALAARDRVELFAAMDPAREVGGDFYDFFELGDHCLAFLIADVSGKGIPASLFMMAAKNEIENRLRAGLSPAEAITVANEHLCAGNEADMFVTAWVATLDLESGLLTYVNAGHNFPLLRHAGQWAWQKERCGLFLGAFEAATYRQKTLVMEPGDELLLYTDGVNEAFSVAGEEYGNDQLEAFLAGHTQLSPAELVPALRADVAAWAEGAEQSDDVTMLALELR